MIPKHFISQISPARKSTQAGLPQKSSPVAGEPREEIWAMGRKVSSITSFSTYPLVFASVLGPAQQRAELKCEEPHSASTQEGTISEAARSTVCIYLPNEEGGGRQL